MLSAQLITTLLLAAPSIPQDAGISWTNVHELAFEGQGWSDVTSPFDRLPAKAEGIVRGPVWSLSRDSAGMCARFVTDATELHCRWSLIDSTLEMSHMPATGVSGVDLYVRDEEGAWRWLACPRPNKQEMNAKLISGIDPGTREYMLYLPLYNGVTSCEVGVPEGASISPGPARPEERALPIVFYGTSITHGGCASRPGMPHPSILGRRLDRPIINLGFSGNGRMDLELADLLGELDACVFVIDCLPNMNGAAVRERVVPFVGKLRALKPETPILLVEDRSFTNSFLLSSKRRHHEASRAALKTGFEELKSSGVKGLHYLEGDGLLSNEDTVDGSHPTDLGFVHQADAFEPALRALLSEPTPTPSPAPFTMNEDADGGSRFRDSKRPKADRETVRPLSNALKWLADHQSEDGSWDTDGFMKHDPKSKPSGGPGQAEHDVGITGLALLALLGNGNTMEQGPFSDEVSKGITWLLKQQSETSGLIGEEVGFTYLYSHAIATAALCEAGHLSKDESILQAAQRAVGLIQEAQNPHGAWRYERVPNGDNDTSVTGWMVASLRIAEDVGLKVDPNVFVGARRWIDKVTDRIDGRVGYDDRGTASARVLNSNDHYPTDQTEALTAIGLISRFYFGQKPGVHDVMEKHADLLMKSLPAVHPKGYTNDMYYWYYGSYAMFQMGGEHWKAWNKAMKESLLATQATKGSEKGSWDPIGPWGFAGGRVYSTALGALCLEVYQRYARTSEDD